MGSRPMIIGDIARKHATQVRLAQNDDVIQTLAAQGTDQPLYVRILPETGRGGHDFRDPQAGDPAAERVAVDDVAISQEPSRCRVVGKGFNDLLHRPRGLRMLRDRKVDDSSALVREQHQDEQHVSGEGQDREEVHRDQGRCVIGQECSPRLGGRTTPSLEESRDGPLRDQDAQFAQFAMDARSSPTADSRQPSLPQVSE